MKLETARTFLLAYLEQGYQADLQGLQNHPNYLREVWIPVTRHWLDPKNGHSKVFPDADDQKRQVQLDNLLQRRVFRLSRYAHPTYGHIVRAVVSSRDRDWGPIGYFVAWDMAEINGTPKLISEYAFCTACAGIGTIPEARAGAGGTCPDCRGEGWTYVRGVQHPNLGAPLEVVRFQDPEQPRHLAAHRLHR